MALHWNNCKLCSIIYNKYSLYNKKTVSLPNWKWKRTFVKLQNKSFPVCNHVPNPPSNMQSKTVKHMSDMCLTCVWHVPSRVHKARHCLTFHIHDMFTIQSILVGTFAYYVVCQLIPGASISWLLPVVSSWYLLQSTYVLVDTVSNYFHSTVSIFQF